MFSNAFSLHSVLHNVLSVHAISTFQHPSEGLRLSSEEQREPGGETSDRRGC